ncbi:cobalt-precorrin-5B (C(1))-methyltransferase CbiD [uncultured Desulfosarcina sp.]|uniref:cobalt-precorrin-5B (C(1))-methyltransferase CbiD n=1 Tax=uncultured Desulfosarcina sp. TaxID=218289 RepID=UPI0029C9882B|nr:cobalt-precorrin-5B (C(1))-methyltransferase CbiD [uncultured Desulfosarcina sp.]
MGRKRQKHLRSGFTTGTAAAAATKAALLFLFDGQAPSSVRVALLNGDTIEVAVHGCERIDEKSAICSVIKDAGDDPDITHGAEIAARVNWRATAADSSVVISGGNGVGKVTKPGLEVPPGQPAINPGPREMIRQSALEAMQSHRRPGIVETVIEVPKGEELARNTLNARLGIVGGISILGTTGIVRPMSHDAYVATIRSALSVARASGLNQVVFTTGRRTERFAQNLWPRLPEESFVQIGDFFARSMAMAVEHGFETVTLAVMFGKAVKMAQKIPHTHASSARMTLKALSRWAKERTGDSDLAARIAEANTARHAFEYIKDDHPGVIEKVGREVIRAADHFAGGKIRVGAVIFDFDGGIKFKAVR